VLHTKELGKNGGLKAKNARRDAGVTGSRHGVTQRIWYARNNYLSREKMGEFDMWSSMVRLAPGEGFDDRESREEINH
jgi:hypothetical protein